MSQNRNRRKQTYQKSRPASQQPRSGRVNRSFDDPAYHSQERWEGRQAPQGPSVQGPFWGPHPDQNRQPHVDEMSDFDYGRRDEGPGYDSHPAAAESMPPYQPHPDYYSEYDEEPEYYEEDSDEPIVHMYTHGNQAPQMGLVLATAAIMMVVMGLAIFWMMGGSGFSRMAAAVSQGEAASAVQPLAGQSENVAADQIVSSGVLASFYAPSVLYWEPQIVNWAAQHNLDPNMVATVMQIESCGDPQAVSSAGASGLFQVMPFHFKSGEDPFDPDTNALRGMNYLAERLIQTNGDVGKAFAGYNGGHVAAAGNWDSWVNETQRYYVWSTGIYDEATRGLTISETLNRWYEAGGRSLCNQAEARLGLN